MTDYSAEAFEELVKTSLPELQKYSDQNAGDVVRLSQDDEANLAVYASLEEIDGAIRLLAGEIMSADGKIPPSLYALSTEPALYRIHVVTSAANIFTQWVLHEANISQVPAFMRNFHVFVMGCRMKDVLEDD